MLCTPFSLSVERSVDASMLWTPWSLAAASVRRRLPPEILYRIARSEYAVGILFWKMGILPARRIPPLVRPASYLTDDPLGFTVSVDLGHHYRLERCFVDAIQHSFVAEHVLWTPVSEHYEPLIRVLYFRDTGGLWVVPASCISIEEPESRRDFLVTDYTDSVFYPYQREDAPSATTDTVLAFVKSAVAEFEELVADDLSAGSASEYESGTTSEAD